MQSISVSGTTLRGERLSVIADRRTQIGLAGVLLVATISNFANLASNGYGNPYYAAAVKSMTESWHNFFFVAFDPGGFVTVDKPPVAFWIQAIFAKIFGFSGLVLMIPEAIAGIVAVALLFHLVRRLFGDVAGLLAALVLAIMPVSVAVNRDNTVDSILALTAVVAAWAATLATERASWRWLLLCAALVGIGFNVKMLEAYLVVPAFAVMYLLGAPTSWRARFGHLALAGVVLLALTFSWMTIVDSIPASQRPYVGSSATNSETELAFGYNGLERLLGRGGPARPAGGNNANAGFAPGETGGVGPLRLFNESLGGQSAWLLPVALMALLAGVIIVVQRSVPLVRGRAPRDALTGTWGAFVNMLLTPQQSAYVMWGMWLLTCAGFFSVAGFFHAYYLSIMAPAIAALVGIGLVALWRLFTGPTWLGWLLPITLVVTAYAQGKLLAPYSDYHWLTVVVLVVGILGALVLSWVRLSRLSSPPTWVQEGNAKLEALRQRVNIARLPQWSALAVLGVAVFALLLAPAAWTVATVNSPQRMIPNAGPGRAFTFNFAGGNLRVSNATVNAAMRNFGGGSANAQLIAYLTKHQAGARYLVATLNANSAAPYILATGKPVMAIGGFSGGDPILTLSQLQHVIATNQVRFFLGQGARTGGTGDRFGTGRSGTSPVHNFGGFGGFGGNANAALSQWVQKICTLVPASAYGGQATSSGSGFPGGALPPGFPNVGRGGFPGGGFGGFGGGTQLYDCSSHVVATASK